jgi:hypothetical protein
MIAFFELLNRVLDFLSGFKKSKNEEIQEIRQEIKEEQKTVEESGRPL